MNARHLCEVGLGAWSGTRGLKPRRAVLVLLFAIAVLAGAPDAGAAGTPAVDVTGLGGGRDYYQGESYCTGFRFTANQALNVTELGFYDDDKDGIVGNHNVGIYDVVTKKLLAKTTVVPSDPLTGFFRYHSLSAPVTLPANRDYFIQAVTFTDHYALEPNIVVDPAITFHGFAGDDGFTPSTKLHYPKDVLSSTFRGTFGPSFKIGGLAPAPTPRPTPDNLDHFVSYGVKGSKGAPAFAPLGPVSLQARNFDVAKLTTLLLPADKNGEGRHDAATHLTEYAVKLAKGEAKVDKVADVRVLNQCSDVFVTLGKPVSLMVPTAKDLANPVTAPVEADHQRDHFLCFQAKPQKKLSDGTAVPPPPKGTQVDAVDQFQTRRYDLGKISKLCIPTDKSGTPSFLKGESKGQPATITPATVRHATELLLCYKVKLASTTIPQLGCGAADPKAKGAKLVPKQPKHTPKSGMFTANQLGAFQLDSTKEVEFCVPSFVQFPIN